MIGQRGFPWQTHPPQKQKRVGGRFPLGGIQATGPFPVTAPLSQQPSAPLDLGDFLLVGRMLCMADVEQIPLGLPADSRISGEQPFEYGTVELEHFSNIRIGLCARVKILRFCMENASYSTLFGRFLEDTNESCLKPRYLATIVFVVILAATGITDAFARDAFQSDVRAEIGAEADALARDISDVMARETAAVDTLAAFVEIARESPTQMIVEFPVFAEALLQAAETIRSVQLAPDSIIRFVHPLDGNEAAFGLDLMADPDRKALLEPAINNGTTVVQGPVELVQGGLGVLVRRPIYNDDGSFWGFAAIVLDWPAVAAHTQFSTMSEDVLAGARILELGKVVAGDSTAFDGNPIIKTVKIGATDTIWEIAVRPAGGWPGASGATPTIWITGLLFAAVAAFAGHGLAVRPEALRRERERAVAELAIAEARYQATFQHAGVGISITDPAGTIISANPAMNRLAGFPVDASLEGMRGRDLIYPADRSAHDAQMQKLLDGASMVQTEVRANGPGDRWVRTSVTMIDGHGEGQHFVAIVEDVTVRRAAELALAKSENRFRQLYEQAPIAIQREDHSSVVEAFGGLREAGLTDLREYLSDSPERLRDLLANVRIIDANPAALELQRHLERGHIQLTLLDRLTDPSAPAFIETLVAIWEGQVTLEQSVESTGPDGEPRFLDLRWHAPLVGDTPDYSNVMVTIADITELRETQQRLEDLIESKDRFLASVAHELRTPLTAVVGFAQELKDELGLYAEPEKEEFRDLIAFHSAELSHIIEDLLVWARGDIGEVRINAERIDLGAGVRQTLKTIKGMSLDVTEPDGSVEAYADPARLRQIVRNLTTNALRYGGSEVSVRVRRSNGHAVVEVSDNGPKMGSGDMSRIFEPYTRADSAAVAPGSIGLGLTVSRSLARLQGGDLVCVREGSHNVFRVSLPVAPEQMLVEARN